MMTLSSFCSDSLLDNINDYVSLMDSDFCFHKVNKKQIKIMGYHSCNEILGRNYDAFKGISSVVAEAFMNEDKMVFEKKTTLRFLSFHKFADDQWHLLLGDKSCLYNESNMQIGIFSQSKDVTHSRLIDLSRFIFESNKKYNSVKGKKGFDCILSDKEHQHNLSEKEMAVLFYFLRGKTAREISQILFRSEKTINFHLENIKLKFDVSSKSELIEKAIFDGFINIFPSAFL